MPSSPNVSRLHYLDWLRGLAAVIMLQGHTFHSFARGDQREGAAYVLSQFAGGITPAIFLFLTGVTLAFRMDGAERRGEPLGRRWSKALARAGYLIGIAFLFRLQLWLFAGASTPWTDLLKVDILNAMALAVAVLSVMVVFQTTERIRLCAVLGLGIAAASPLMSQADWSGIPQIVQLYLKPDYAQFSFFPWAAYLAFGMSAGSALRVIREEHMDRAMQWAAILGGGLILSSRYAADTPYSLYSTSEFWLNSPAQVLIKLGVVLWLMALAFLWTRYTANAGWGWIRQLGTTSLLVYWVHIELVYGRWLNGWKGSLDVGQTVLATAGVVALMAALSAARTFWSKWSHQPAGLGWYPFLSPRVSND